MPRRSASRKLTPVEREAIRLLQDRPYVPDWLRLRFEIAKLQAENLTDKAIAEKTGVSRHTVMLWRKRFLANGLTALMIERRVKPATSQPEAATPEDVSTSTAPGLAEIAALAGVSKATVSLALRDHPRISLPRRQAIRDIAQRIGYVANPLVSAHQATVRRRSAQSPVPRLAWLSDRAEEIGSWRGQVLLEAAQVQAHRLGYELHEVRFPAMTDLDLDDGAREEYADALSRKLRHGGTYGLVLHDIAYCSLVATRFKQLAVVALGRMDGRLTAWRRMRKNQSGGRALYHQVFANDYENFRLAWAELLATGHRRIGVILRRTRDQNANIHFSAALHIVRGGSVRTHDIPLLPLGRDSAAREAKHLAAWSKRWKPDAILTNCEASGDLHSLGRIGAPLFFLRTQQEGTAWTGVDTAEVQLAATAINALTSQLQMSKIGPPDVSQRITIDGSWHDGDNK